MINDNIQKIADSITSEISELLKSRLQEHADLDIEDIVALAVGVPIEVSAGAWMDFTEDRGPVVNSQRFLEHIRIFVSDNQDEFVKGGA